MRITVDDKVIKKRKDDKMSIVEVLFVAAVLNGLKKESIQNMLNREILVVHNGEYMVTQRWAEVAQEIMLDSSDLCPKTNAELLQLAEKVQAIFPKMKQPDLHGRPTQYWFRCNKAEIMRSLKRFYVTFHDIVENVTDEEILDATKRYVAAYAPKGYIGMRLAKYFPIKEPTKEDSEGNIRRGLVSDLLTYLENKEEEEEAITTGNDWQTKLI